MGDVSESGLCCCEYVNSQGERSHLLALCCDCEALDSAVDTLVKGGHPSSDKVREVLDVMEERLRFPWKGGAVKIPLSSTIPFILLPGLMMLASVHYIMAILVFTLLLPSLFLFLIRIIVRHKPKTRFFINWSIVTTLFLFYVYEVKAVGTFWDLPKLISWYENLVLVLGMFGSAVCCWKLKSDFSRSNLKEGKMCRVCEVHVKDRDHHCVWIDMCIHNDNLNLFIGFLMVTCFTCAHLALMLCSYACPGTLLGPVLLPDICWPDKSTDALILVSGVYSGIIATLLLILLIGYACRK